MHYNDYVDSKIDHLTKVMINSSDEGLKKELKKRIDRYIEYKEVINRCNSTK